MKTVLRVPVRYYRYSINLKLLPHIQVCSFPSKSLTLIRYLPNFLSLMLLRCVNSFFLRLYSASLANVICLISNFSSVCFYLTTTRVERSQLSSMPIYWQRELSPLRELLLLPMIIIEYVLVSIILKIHSDEQITGQSIS